MKLSKREIILLYVLVIALIIFVAVTFVIKPIAKKLSAISSTNLQLEQEYRVKKNEAQQTENLTEKIDALREQLNQTGGKFLTDMPDTDLYRYAYAYFTPLGYSCEEAVIGDRVPVQHEGAVSETLLLQTVSLMLTAEFATDAESAAQAEAFVSGFRAYMKSAVIDTCSWDFNRFYIKFSVFSLS